MNNTISVALCTYNGDRFLADQLASLAAQSRLPDEVVVCDDGSSDGTLRILQAFAESAPFPVAVHRNDRQLGVALNFSRAISLCSGSVVALADQDDVWMHRKLERVGAIFDERPSVGAVFSDAELVDERLQPFGRTLFEAIGFSERRQERFRQGGALEVLLSRSVCCGATLAFRAECRSAVLPVPPSGLHDVWLAVILSASTEMVGLSEPLIRYRQHADNQIGAPTSGLRTNLARRRRQMALGDELAHYREMATRIARQRGVDSQATARLNAKIRHLEVRHGLPGDRHRRLQPVLTEFARGRYHRYSRGLRSAGFDLVFRQPA